MRPKLLMTPLGAYMPVEWNGKNESGFKPIGDRVLILPDKAADETSGHVFVPEDIQERMTMAAETGVLVAMGESAWFWNSDRTRRFEGEKPVIGQRVRFERYAGAMHHGADGQRYRVMDDKCLSGVEELAPEASVEVKKLSPLTKVIKPPLVVAR